MLTILAIGVIIVVPYGILRAKGVFDDWLWLRIIMFDYVIFNSFLGSYALFELTKGWWCVIYSVTVPPLLLILWDI
jgi:hypothetical protein